MSDAVAGTPAATTAPAEGATAAAAQATEASATEATNDLSTMTPEALAAEVAKWKALSRKNEDTAKANADKAKQYDALEESKKSDLQKAQDELARVQAELDAERGGSLKASVAAAKGVPAELLTGSTKEELEASATALLAFKGPAEAPSQDAAASAVGGKPVNAGADQLTAEQLKGMTSKEIMEAKAAGRLDKLQGKQ